MLSSYPLSVFHVIIFLCMPRQNSVLAESPSDSSGLDLTALAVIRGACRQKTLLHALRYIIKFLA